MNKTDIKQIILEEIKAALKEANNSPEMMAAKSFIDDEELDDKRAADAEGEDDITPPGPEDMPGATVSPFATDQEIRIARAMETGDEDELEDLAAGELDRAGLEEMARTANVFKLSQNADIKQVLQFMQRVNDVLKTYKSPGQKRPKKRFTPEEMKALAVTMVQDGGFTSKDVIVATSYSSPAQANKFLKALEMKGLITLTSQLKKAQEPARDPNAPETRGRKRKDAEFDIADDPTMMDFGDFDDLDLSDPLAEDAGFGGAANLELKNAAKQIYRHFGSFAQAKIIGRSANKSDIKHFTTKNINPAEPFAVIFMNGSDVDPEEHLFVQIGAPNPEARKDAVARIKSKFPKFEYKSSESSMGEIFIANLVIKPGKTTSENKTTMSELEKYIKQQIKEAKNPLAKKMKEIENQGRLAALETKLAAVAEMIEETEGRLTRIDEDNEFRDMMDRNAVKEVRKQLKELEKAKGKLEKEKAKLEGKGMKAYKSKEVMDEDLPVAEDAVENAVDEIELEEDNFKLNESTLRMQKLAGLITESDIKKKLSLNENQMKNLAKLLRDEAKQPDSKVGKSIFLKYAAQAEKTDVKDIKSLLRKLEDELIDKHPDTFSGDDDIVGSFLSTSKK